MLDPELFESYITEAIGMVPEHIRRGINNVAFVVDDEKQGNLLGLYHGIPLTRRGQGYTGVLPDKITIYQRSIEASAGEDPEKIKKLTIDVVHHEIGHYFGFDEAKVRAWEKHRRDKKKTPRVASRG